MTSRQSVHDALARVRARHGDKVASVVHLAAYYNFNGEPSPLYEQIDVQGTRRLLDELSALQVEQLLFSSTMLVYAPCQPGQRINEDWPLEPKWAYPQAKVRTEELIHERHGHVPTVILRLAGVYDDLCHSIPISQQIKRIYQRQLISHVFPGDLSHGQAFLHVDDTVESFVRAIERRTQLPEEVPILIGEEVTLSYGDLQNLIAQELFGEDWVTERIPKELARVGAWVEGEIPLGEEPFIKPWMMDIDDDHYALDCTRAHQLLGWQPTHSLRATLPRMLEALKQDPEAWYKANKLEMPHHLFHHEAQPLPANLM
jgi:nucleoside-diphosphate-sugar epimerase